MTEWKIRPCCKMMTTMLLREDDHHRYTSYVDTNRGPIGTMTLTNLCYPTSPSYQTITVNFCPFCGKKIDLEEKESILNKEEEE